VELLTEFNFEQAQQFASEIEQYNSDRKDLDKTNNQRSISQMKKIKNKNDTLLLFIKRIGTKV
jgi:single-stranded-DNA-specific exonuclease